MPAILVALYAWVLCWPLACQADTVRVAVAANFAPTLVQLSPLFTQAQGHHLQIIAGASGKLAAQIQQGAPFEVFLSADDRFPAQATTRFTYALGRLVLWQPSPKTGETPDQVLRQGAFQHLALANPETAPYGRAAWETLSTLGLVAAVKPKVVTGESVGQALHFAQVGGAELAFVSAAQVPPRSGLVWHVPPTLHRPIVQEVVLIKGTPTARQFMEWLRSPTARRVIHQAGYDLPPLTDSPP